MSSEKRSMSPKTFESVVPPLETIRSLSCGSVNSFFRTQQTQKSFSMMGGPMPRGAADSRNRSRRSSARRLATLSIGFFLRDSLNRNPHPTGGSSGVRQRFGPEAAGKPAADFRNHFGSDAVRAKGFKS